MRHEESFASRMVDAAIAVAVFLLLILSFVLVTAGHTQAQSVAEGKPATHQKVAIDNFSFSPSTLTIRAGTTVTWVNHDDVPHNVVSTEKKFKSSVLDTDEEFSFTFTDVGTYDYYCSLHPRMTGKVIVQ